MLLSFLSILIFTINSAYGNYFFASHSNYTASSLTTSVSFSTKIAGDLLTVTQQCRRNCATNPLCKAFHLKLLQNTPNLGVFNCSFFAQNACSSNQTSLTANIAVRRLFDKLDAKKFKPKPCIEHCGLKFRGDCSACRGNKLFKGFDCEIAPRVCSEYPSVYFNDSWVILPIWPWGIYRPSINVWCRNTYETLLIFSYNNGIGRILRTSFLTGFEYQTTNLTNYTNTIDQINWPLLSELQGLAGNKILNVHLLMDVTQPSLLYKYGGLELGSSGELSLNSSLSSSNGFPVPFIKAPFVLRPTGYGDFCGPFWQFETNVPICQQRTKLLNIRNIQWDGVTANFSGFVALTFT